MGGAEGHALICQEALAQTVRGQTIEGRLLGKPSQRTGRVHGENPQEGEEISRGVEDTSLWKEAHAARP